MIYLGNGIFSDDNPNEYLQHYGVIGMKWGVHKAKEHLKLLRSGRSYGSRGYYDRENRKAAKEQYKKDLAEITEFAKANKKKKGVKARDIESLARNKAREEFGENYDKLYRGRKVAKGIRNGLLGLSAAGAVAGTVYQNKANRKWEKENGLKTKINPFHTYAMNDNANKKLKVAGTALGGTVLGSLGADTIKNAYTNEMMGQYWKKKYMK